jgi:hypothetical protein
MAETRDQEIVEEMWTLARNEPLTLAALSPFGVLDRDRYRRRVGDVTLELTLDSDRKTGIWSYELAILNAEGEALDSDTIQYWLHAFFGRDAHFAARRNFLMTGEARFTFPFAHRV